MMVLLIGLLVLVLVGGIVGAVLAIRAAWQSVNGIEARSAEFVGAPVGVGMVTGRRWRWAQLGLNRLAEVTFVVEGVDGQQFEGTAEMMLPYSGIGGGGLKDYPVGQLRPVRYLPGRRDVVVGDPQSYEAQKALVEYHARRGIGY
ncbi:MAG: hypothetical protein E7L00_05300 [Propionibacteriaceae bacterium]|nr:hypothetical protein [Propionibacteriaceae bacterium]